MTLFGLAFLLYFFKLSAGNGLYTRKSNLFFATRLRLETHEILLEETYGKRDFSMSDIQ